MAVKAHRGLTHYRKLKAPEPWVERFERCWNALGDRAEALLVQLHPAMQRDDERLDHFLGLMPKSIPVAMELRHVSWNVPAVFSLLERHGAAYVVMSGAGMPCVPRATSDLVYVRMHGPEPASLYTGSYSDDELQRWADRLVVWQQEGKCVDVYFNNDLGGHAVRNARRLKDLTTPG